MPLGADLGESTNVNSSQIKSDAFWAQTPEQLFTRLQSDAKGLSASMAGERLRRVGPNELREERPLTRMRVLAHQLANPLLLLLLFAAAVAAATGEWMDAGIVLTIVLVSVLIGYSREYSAHAAAAALKARVRVQTKVLRDGRECMAPLVEIVPGDIILLCAGNLVPRTRSSWRPSIAT